MEMASDAKEPATPSTHSAPSEQQQQKVKVKWYRSTVYNALILGICNFCEYIVRHCLCSQRLQSVTDSSQVLQEYGVQ